MPTSPMLDKGPCVLVWDFDGDDPTYLGKTLGGVKIGMETSVSDINEDQAGDAAVNAVLTGSTLTVEATLTRLSVAELARVLNTVESGCVIPIENQIGCDLYSMAKELVLIPICGNVPSDNECEWIRLYKVYPVAGLDLMFDKDTQRVFPVKFKVFVSQEAGFEGKFGTIGMESGASAFGY